MKKLLITFLKICISAAIIGYLVYDATQSDEHGNVFADLVDQPKHWGLLAAAWASCTMAVLLTFIRWWYLVRALDVPCRFADAIRIGFWGYLFNLAPLGMVGGDLVKAVMLGHEHPQHRTNALASVLVDRVIGLYMLFVVASAAILLTGFWRIDLGDYWWICPMTFVVTIVSTVGLGIVMGPDMTDGRVIRALGRIPRIGQPLESLINAVRMYNRKPLVLVASSVMSIGVHTFFAIGCYLIACGLFDYHLSNLSLARHFVVMPLSVAMQVIPVPVGPTEFAMTYLYPSVRIAGPVVTKGQGLIVALAYRLITVLIAAMGAFYYLTNRREMAEVIHESATEEAELQEAASNTDASP